MYGRRPFKIIQNEKRIEFEDEKNRCSQWIDTSLKKKTKTWSVYLSLKAYKSIMSMGVCVKIILELAWSVNCFWYSQVLFGIFCHQVTLFMCHIKWTKIVSHPQWESNHTNSSMSTAQFFFISSNLPKCFQFNWYVIFQP